MDVHAAWWSGDKDALARIYGRPEAPSRGRPRRARDRTRFWGRQDPGQDRQRLHVPAAADIATTSADLLFGEAPALVVAAAHEANADATARSTQDRILELDETTGIAATLVEAAEMASALGGVYLRPVWAPQVADCPLLTAVAPTQVVAEFRYGLLTAATVWSIVARDGARVWRHLERYEPGVILHGLYEGTETKLGPRRPLDASPATSGLDTQPDGSVLLPDGLRGQLLIHYVPNVRPLRRYRGGVGLGRSDLDGVADQMDALDECWSSWMRDIRLAKARIIVPDQYLDRTRRGAGASFDADREVFSPLDIDPGSDGGGITLTQFAIRTAEHAATATALYEQIVKTPGYSPATFGLAAAGGGAGETATKTRALEARSLRTTGRKQAYWRLPVSRAIEQMLIIDREVFRAPVEPMPVSLRFADGLPDDPMSTAQTISLLAQAEAVSVETRVRMAQPDLDEAEVVAEVARIQAETSMTVSDPTGGLIDHGAAG